MKKRKIVSITLTESSHNRLRRVSADRLLSVGKMVELMLSYWDAKKLPTDDFEGGKNDISTD